MMDLVVCGSVVAAQINTFFLPHERLSATVFQCEETWIVMFSCRSALWPSMTVFIFHKSCYDALYIH